MAVVDEKKNKRLAAASTISIHALMLLFFFFVVGWRAPDPPMGELGYVINLGFDDEGSGDVQPDQPVGSEQPQTNPDTQTPQDQPQQEIKETPQETKEDQLVAKDDEAVAVKDVKDPKKKEDEPVKPVETKEKTDTKAKEPEKPIAVYDPNAKKGTDSKAGQPGGEGDDVNKTGDKGQPDGTPGPGLYKGKVGGGGGNGPGLSIDGWIWDEMPKVKPPENESNGRLVFTIKVNADGEIIDIKKESGTLSIEMENRCRREIEKLTFSKIGNNVPSVSTGKITFVVLSN